jgi:hypothetical protein
MYPFSRIYEILSRGDLDMQLLSLSIALTDAQQLQLRLSNEQLPNYEEGEKRGACGSEERLAGELGLGCARGICIGAVLQIIALSVGAMCLGCYWFLG